MNKRAKTDYNVIKLGGNLAIVIGARFAKELGIEKGDKLNVGVNAERLIMRKVLDGGAEGAGDGA